MKISANARKAIYIGSLCSTSYLAVYIARNILSAVTPQMIAAGYTKDYIASISSLYLVFYAVGQLINGAIGDRIKAKWMIAGGLLGAGAMNLVFSLVAATPIMAMAAYGLTGFFLSMIYGPMTKVVSENTEPLYTTRCSLGYTFASFFGTPSAGLLASFLAWESVFAVSSAVLGGMAVIAFVFFSLFERRGIVKYGQYKPQKEQGGKSTVKELCAHKIVKFAIIALLTGVVRTSVVFWLPTYINENLGMQQSESIFAVATFIISFTAFISVFVYEKLGHDMNKTILLMFSSSAIFFTLTYFVQIPVLNLVFIVLAIMSSNGASTMMYSRYCPSLRDTGRVSSVTGFLDFLSYMSAAAANLIFGNAVDTIGWGNLILVWLGLMIVGVINALPYDKIKEKRKRA